LRYTFIEIERAQIGCYIIAMKGFIFFVWLKDAMLLPYITPASFGHQKCNAS